MRNRHLLVPALLILSIALHACSDAPASDLTTSASLAIGSDVKAMTGTISSLAGTCPAVTFLFERRTVTTDRNTVFGDVGCSTLKNTLRAEVSGTVLSDGSIKATRVAPIGTVTQSVPATPPSTTTYAGNITALSGSCPTLTISVGERRASTTASTVFNVKGCGDLRVDGYVEIVGNTTATANAFIATTVTGRK